MTHTRNLLPIPGFKSSANPTSLWLSLILFAVATVATAFGQQAKQPDYQGGRGRVHVSKITVPFKPGPFGKDGKVHQVTPDPKARRFPPETETPQEKESAIRAAAGIFDLTTKVPSSSLSAHQLSLLNWNPSKLNPAENPLMNSELLKAPVGKKDPLQLPKFTKPSSVPVSGKNFAGIGDTGYFPPDGGIAAGPLQLVEVVNSNINVYDKNGNLLSSQTLNNFFSGLGTPGSDFLYDPSIYYDQVTGRFWVLATSENDSPARSNHLVAVSAGDDVTFGWLEYFMDATVDGGNATNNWCDYPHMGMDADAIYISCNQFNFPSTAAGFQYAKVRIMNKDEFINNACCSWWDYWNLKEGFLNLSTSFTIRPALERWVGHGFGDFWVDTEGGGGSGSTVKVWQLTNATACCDGSGGPTLVGNEQGVGSYGGPPAAAQPNGVQGLDSGGTRVLYATYQFGHLSFGHGLACNQGGTTDACAGFTEIDVSSYPTMTNINDWFYTQPAGQDVTYPFVDQNVNSDKLMVYSRSSVNDYPGAYYTTIPNTGTCTFCTGGETTMQAGSANYSVIDSQNRNRWGDYQGASNDPDLLGIWVEGEYAPFNNYWEKDIEAGYNSYNPIDSASGPLNFGNQPVFSSTATQYVTFTNTGNATMYTNITYISGDSDFFITFDGCRSVTLQPGNSCSEGVAFSPNSVGAGSGFIVVLDNSPSGFADATLSGTGVQAGTSTFVGSSLNPSTYGQNVTFTAQVFSSTAGTPTGSVTFYNFVFNIGTVNLSGGIAQLSTSTLTGGPHNITAAYNGSTNYVTSSASVNQTVNPAATTTGVTSSLNPSTFGSNVTFTATVSSGAGTPIGTVTFKDGAASIGTGALSGGHATLTTAALGGGNHSITAVYGGTANFATSASGAITQTVHAATTASALTASVNPSSYNQSVTFTAKVTSGGGIPAGTVTFKSGGATVGTGALNGSGVATFATNALIVGAHSITAVYAGNGNFAASTSAVLAHTVNKAKTTSTVTSSVDPSSYHQFVTLTAKLVGAFGGQVFGTVTFKSGTVTIGTGLLNSSGIAVLSTNALAVGAHSITAVYGGNGNYLASTSPVKTQTVNKATTKTNLASSKNPSTHGTAVTFTATVVPAFGGSATGKVTFKDGTTTLGMGTVATNKATFTTSALAVGTHSITAVYPGDINLTTSTSVIVKQVVK